MNRQSNLHKSDDGPQIYKLPNSNQYNGSPINRGVAGRIALSPLTVG